MASPAMPVPAFATRASDQGQGPVGAAGSPAVDATDAVRAEFFHKLKDAEGRLGAKVTAVGETARQALTGVHALEKSQKDLIDQVMNRQKIKDKRDAEVDCKLSNIIALLNSRVPGPAQG